MDPIQQFKEEVKKNIEALGNDKELKELAIKWIYENMRKNYIYNFTWMGRPIIQLPQDTVALQELIWKVKPDVIIETGIAHGGSLIFSASMQKLVGKGGRVIGVDIDIRSHNREEIEAHPMYDSITMLEGSSTSPEIINEIKNLIQPGESVLVCLDSYHTYDHVMMELDLYGQFVTKGSYLVAFDGWVEQMPPNFYPDRPWDVGDNPLVAVKDWLKVNEDFELDKSIEDKLLLTLAPHGYLRRKS